MANPQSRKLTQLDVAGPLSRSDRFYTVQDGRSKQTTLGAVQDASDTSCQCTLVSRYNTVGTDGNTVEKYLQTWQMPANTLPTDGSFLEIYAYGGCANNSHVKTIKLRFGSTVLNGQTVTSPNNVGWYIKAVVIRTSQTTQKALTVSEITLSAGGTDGTLPAEDLLSDVPISISGENGTAAVNDITCEGFIIKLNLVDPNS